MSDDGFSTRRTGFFWELWRGRGDQIDTGLWMTYEVDEFFALLKKVQQHPVPVTASDEKTISRLEAKNLVTVVDGLATGTDMIPSFRKKYGAPE